MMNIDSIKEITNEQRHNFYRRLAMFMYEVEMSKDDADSEAINIALKELSREGVATPENVVRVRRSVDHYRKVANTYGASWILVEAVTEKKIETYDEDTELNDFIKICKRVAEVNADFLETAMGIPVQKKED